MIGETTKDDSLEQIAKEITECAKCKICTHITNKVIGRGCKSPTIVFVGEAAGKDEDLAGKPFVGPSGRLLDQWIGHLGLQPEDYAILNVCKCRPTDGDDRNRTPSQEEIDSCLPYLKRQLAILKPQIIVTLGAVALKAIAPNMTESITAVAGRFVEGSAVVTQPIYVMLHPAFFLRKGESGEIYLKNLILQLGKLGNGDKETSIDFCGTLTINQQTAKNMATQEMVSPQLSAIHAFCKKAGAVFKDKNQSDECYIDEKLCKIVVRGAAEDVDFLINDKDIAKQKYDYWVIGYSEKGNYNFVGFVDRDILGATVSRDHFGKGFLTKAVQPASFIPIWKLIPVKKEEKEEEEKIEMQNFVPLHLHTEYSVGDGYGKLPDIGKILKKKGYRACAVTDHGTLSGTIYFQKACLENGIKPILGVENYVVFGDKKSAGYHLVLLAKNKTGWKNLLKLHDDAARDNFYYKPRMKFDDVLKNSEGLIAMTACTSGIISKHIIEGQTDKAREVAVKLKEAFGEDLYFEIIFNEGVPHQKEVNEALLKFAEELDVKCVVTSDSHYPNKEDAEIHQAIKAVSYNKPFEESGFSDTTFYYLQDKDVYELSQPHKYATKEKVKELIENTNEVADKCNFIIEKDWDELLPDFPVPEDIKDKFFAWCDAKGHERNEDSLLRYVALKGFHKKKFAGNKEYEDRLELELDRFITKGYSKYFLVVWDYVNFCKKQGIMVGPGRGSVGASLVSYCMGITELDPIKYNLLFDRFVSEIRKDMPDIDLDFEDVRRGEVIDYLREKYGEKKCAKVVTFSRWHGKGALRDAGRIFNIDKTDINRITNLVIQRSGGDARADFCLDDTFSEFEQAKEFEEKYPKVVKTAKALEGCIRHQSLHAAAMVVTDKDIFEYVPTHKINGEMTTAWEKNEVENFGLIKFDILGLKTLNVISKTLKMIRESGREVSLPETFDDPEVYEKVFKTGNTLGVFQFETSGMSKLSKQMQIDQFKYLYDASCLYRPGPLHSGQAATYVLRHQGKQEWDFEHPLLEPISKDNYGLILYQEQIMEIMHKIGKFSWATSEMSRKIITKSKGKHMFEKLRNEFIENAQREHDMDPADSGKIFDVVSTFGSYGFNKVHAVEYSMISYYCAWLKTKFPCEFYSCLLGTEDDSTRFADYIRDAKNSGVKVILPNVNHSRFGFAPHKEGIIGGFRGIIGIGDKTAEKLVISQPYENILDFIRRGKPNLTVFKALLSVGALDDWVENRKVVFENAEELLKAARRKRDEIKDVAEFFSLVDQTQPDWTEKERAETMLQYYSVPGDKPAIAYYDDPFEPYLKDKYEKIGEMEFDDYVDERWIKGIVTFVNHKMEGMEGQWTMFDNILERRYCHLNVNDGSGNVLVHLAPEQYNFYKRILERGAGFPVIIKGHSIKDFNKLYCDAMIVLNDIDESNPIIKYIKFNQRQEEVMKALKLFPGMHVEVIQAVTYKVSKNKKPYARIKTTKGKDYLCFKLDENIFAAGQILIFHVTQDPFIKVINRL